jgi:hypothetical protein
LYKDATDNQSELKSEIVEMPDEIVIKDGAEEMPDEISLENLENVKEEDAPEKKGGSYGEVYKEGEGEKYEVHHMPADSTTNLERNDGPAIKMEKEDHRQTASCGSSRDAREYRAQQKELIDQGKFKEALQMDIDDIHDKFGDKYDDAIEEMLDYVNKLETEGKIDG